MNDIQLNPWKKPAYMGSKKVSTGQNFYSNEYYAEQALPPVQKNNRIGLRSMSRTELSEERAKSRTNKVENVLSRKPSEQPSNTDSIIKLQSVKSQPRLATGVQESSRLSLLQKDSKVSQPARESSRFQRSGCTQKSNNKAECYLTMKTKSKMTLHLENKALESYLDELKEKQLPDSRHRAGSEEIAIMNSTTSENGSKLAKSRSKQDTSQQDCNNISRVLEGGPNYLRVSNYSTGGQLEDISRIQEQPASNNRQSQCKVVSSAQRDESLSLINYLSKFKDEETADHIDDQQPTEESLINLLSCSIIPQRKTPPTIMGRLYSFNILTTSKQSSIKRIEAHAEIIRLYEEMSELGAMFSDCPSWSLLRALLYSKFYAERTRIEMALRGHANCFTLTGLNVSNKDLNELQRFLQLGSIIGKVNRQNETLLVRLKKLTEPFRGSRAEFNENTFTNTLLVTELRKQYVRLCQLGSHPHILEKLGWIVAIVLLTEQLRNPLCQYFSGCLHVPTAEYFLREYYPIYSQVLQQF